MKRKAKKKAASVKAWGARVEQVKDAVSKKQQIRTHNLDQRKLGGSVAANLSSKRIVVPNDEKDAKGGKVGEGADGKRRRAGPHANRAGFEGKKQGFINGKSSGDGEKPKGKQ